MMLDWVKLCLIRFCYNLINHLFLIGFISYKLVRTVVENEGFWQIFRSNTITLIQGFDQYISTIGTNFIRMNGGLRSRNVVRSYDKNWNYSKFDNNSFLNVMLFNLRRTTIIDEGAFDIKIRRAQDCELVVFLFPVNVLPQIICTDDVGRSVLFN